MVAPARASQTLSLCHIDLDPPRWQSGTHIRPGAPDGGGTSLVGHSAAPCTAADETYREYWDEYTSNTVNTVTGSKRIPEVRASFRFSLRKVY